MQSAVVTAAPAHYASWYRAMPELLARLQAPSVEAVATCVPRVAMVMQALPQLLSCADLSWSDQAPDGDPSPITQRSLVSAVIEREVEQTRLALADRPMALAAMHSA
eukprot:13653462-Alexandrium_andersonii.AAC.1